MRDVITALRSTYIPITYARYNITNLTGLICRVTQRYNIVAGLAQKVILHYSKKMLIALKSPNGRVIKYVFPPVWLQRRGGLRNTPSRFMLWKPR